MPNSSPKDARALLRPDRLLVVAGALCIAVLSLSAMAVVAAGWRAPDTEQLAEQLRNDDDPVVRSRAAWRLGEYERRDGAVWCVDGLRDKDARVRLVSAWALGEIKDRGTIAPLIDVLEKDEDTLVREMAALALGEIESPKAVDALVDAFEREPDLRLAVIWALGEIEGAGSRKARWAREEACESLGRWSWKNEQVWTGSLDKHPPYSDDVRALLERLRSDDADSRREAALSLGYLGIRHRYESEAEVESVVDALIEMLRDPVPEVRAAAVWSLDEINPSRSARYHMRHSFRNRIEKIREILGLS